MNPSSQVTLTIAPQYRKIYFRMDNTKYESLADLKGTFICYDREGRLSNMSMDKHMGFSTKWSFCVFEDTPSGGNIYILYHTKLMAHFCINDNLIASHNFKDDMYLRVSTPNSNYMSDPFTGTFIKGKSKTEPVYLKIGTYTY